MHIVLAGDSIFDNGAYVPGESDLVEVLRGMLGPGEEASLLAVDGSVSMMVGAQLAKLPRGATRLFISSGGNDALACRFVLDAPGKAGFELPRDRPAPEEPPLEELPLASPAAMLLRGLSGVAREREGVRSRLASIATLPDLLDRVAALQDEFRAIYAAMLDTALRTRLPLCVCTVYDAVPGIPPRHRAALSAFNDVILREASFRGLQVIDLRNVCSEAADYALSSPIEPSLAGSRKIAQRILRAARDPVGPGLPCRVYA